MEGVAVYFNGEIALTHSEYLGQAQKIQLGSRAFRGYLENVQLFSALASSR